MTQGKRVVVTGAAHGIGRAIATRLAHEGARVVVSDVDHGELQAVADDIGALPITADVSTEQGVTTLVSAAKAHLGGIDVFFANAGIAHARGLEDTSDEDWSRIVEVNVMSHVRAARALLPHWQEQGGGRFVVTASAAGLLTILGDPSYAVTKHGAVAFAEWLSATYRHRGVVVQAICPQGVQTRMLGDSGQLKDVVSHDRVLEPEEVADAVWNALQTEQFYVLPHPEVEGYYAVRAAEPDRWLAGMNRLQQKLEAAQPAGGQS